MDGCWYGRALPDSGPAGLQYSRVGHGLCNKTSAISNKFCVWQTLAFKETAVHANQCCGAGASGAEIFFIINIFLSQFGGC